MWGDVRHLKQPSFDVQVGVNAMKPLIALALFIAAIASAQTPVIAGASGTPVTSSGTPVMVQAHRARRPRAQARQ